MTIDILFSYSRVWSLKVYILLGLFSLLSLFTFTLSLSVLSLNARGLRQICKRKALFLFAKKFRTDFCFFQESHSLSSDVNFWKSQWGNDAWFSHGSERSAGVATFKNVFSGTVLHSENDSLGHYTCLVVESDHCVFITVNVYGYNTKPENDQLLDSLESKINVWLSKYPNSFILIGGDFNVTLNNAIDRWPPGQNTIHNLRLKSLMETLNVVDIWREKFPDDRSYTWSNRSGSRQSRIDFWLVSNNLPSEMISVNVLTTPLTDHRAIYISIQFSASNKSPYRSSYWKLNSSLLQHNAVQKEIKNLSKYFWDKAKKRGILWYKLGTF